MSNAVQVFVREMFGTGETVRVGAQGIKSKQRRRPEADHASLWLTRAMIRSVDEPAKRGELSLGQSGASATGCALDSRPLDAASPPKSTQDTTACISRWAPSIWRGDFTH